MEIDRNLNEIPKLSKELEIAKVEDNYLVENKKLNVHFRISAETNSLLSIIDGKRNIEELKSILEYEYNINISTRELREFIYTNLGSKGFLSNSDMELRLKKRQYLKLTLTIIPKKIVDRIAKKLILLFNPTVMKVFISISLILSSFILSSNWTLINTNWYSQLTLGNLSVFIPLFIANIVWHELGHATACKYFNTSVGRIGFGFYFLSPVLFADVSGAWTLSKNNRLIVNIGGVYFESMLVSFLLLLFLLTNKIPLLFLTLFILTNTLVLNLNPFLRADGYWIISDLLEIVNLRSKSIAVTKLALKRNIRYTRNTIFLLVYGIFNFLILLFFLSYTVFFNGHLLIQLPRNIVELVFNINNIFSEGSLIKFIDILIPSVFYYLVIRMVVKYCQKRFVKNKSLD